MPKSNFQFLEPNWRFLLEDAQEAERTALIKPRTAAFYARRTLERMVNWIYENDGSVRLPYQNNLKALLYDDSFQRLVTPGLFKQMKLIHRVGNQAVHSNAKLRDVDGLHLVKALHIIANWLLRSYERGAVQIMAFNEALLPRPGKDISSKDTSAEQLNKLQQQFEAEKARIESERQKQTAELQAQIEKHREEIAAIKAANAAAVAAMLEEKQPDLDKSEAETRELLIDVMLRESGWEPADENVREYEVTGMPNKAGVGYVDYVLWGEDGLPLAVVEAKKTSVSLATGQQQAKLYADCLEQMTGRRPVIYLSNGYETRLWDNHFYPPRDVQGFANRSELELMIRRRQTRKDITRVKVDDDIAGRYYQKEGIQRTMERFSKENQRAALLVMATGSGKTRTAIAAVDILLKHNWVKRALFLADRTALVSQAKKNFIKLLPHASAVNLSDPKSKDTENEKTRLVFSTYHTMMNLVDERKNDQSRRFGPNYFDLIIIDEAHRSVYQRFGAIFQYFDSLLLGLTATPKAEVDKNTYSLFNLADDVPTYAYELEQAVNDGFLVPPKAVSVPLKFQREGIHYDDLSDEEKAEWESEAGFFDEETGQMREDVDAAELNQWLFNINTVEKVLAHLMEHGIKVEGGDRLGKTIIFAKNRQHAEFIVDVFDDNYPQYKGEFCQQISHGVNYVSSRIENFEVSDKDPHIAVSVDMLDTGIDVPSVVNLVFFKRVRSKTKFWQMIGRGTRLCPDLFGPGKDKQYFQIFDFCQNLEFFDANPGGVETGAQESVSQKIFKRRLELVMQLQQRSDSDEAYKVLHSDLLDELHGTVTRMNPDNFIVRPHRKMVDQWNDRNRWKKLSVGDQAELSAQLSSLPAPDDDHELSRRFDLLMLNLQLALQNNDPAFSRLQEQVQSIGKALESKESIPAVAKQMALILELQSEEYWQDINLPLLEQLRRNLRELVRFIDKGAPQQIVYTDFEDEIGEDHGEYNVVSKDDSLSDYRVKVERFIREHDDHPTIQRIHNNQPVTLEDIEAFEALLFGELGEESRAGLKDSFGVEQPVGKLIRQIIGLDRNAAKKALAKFYSKKPLSGDQQQFLNQIVDHLVKNGFMEEPGEKLFNAPFNFKHQEGLLGVFPDDAEELLALIGEVNGSV